MMKISRENGIQAIYGGLFLGGGGGGSIKDGISLLDVALNNSDYITVKPITALNDDDIIITASMVGAPSSKDKYVDSKHWEKVFKLFEKNVQTKISGIITNENGGTSTTNGWLLSVLTGIPIIDAPCNGRAHPTGTMGSMGLASLSDYCTVQAAAGGKLNKNIEFICTGNINSTSKLVRQTAIEAGGLVCVLRNPVTKSYVEKNGAIGGIEQAIEIGKIIYNNIGSPDKILLLLKCILDIEVLCSGIINDFELISKGGFDVGQLYIEDNDNSYQTTFWNEYMTVECSEARIATFPDLIVTLDAKTGIPKTSAEIGKGDDIVILKVPKNKIKLGSGMYDKNLFKDIEDILNKEIIKYSF